METVQGASGASNQTFDLQHCHDDIERLTRLPGEWAGRDPTSIAEHVLETLLDMLGLDIVGIQFNDAPHIFWRVDAAFGRGHELEDIVAAVNLWLPSDPQSPSAKLAIGDDMLSAVALPLSDISSIGVLIAASRRTDFPAPGDMMRLRVAASLTSLAIREVRELNDRRSPMDTRTEKPLGAELAESEWNLNLVINTIPAMAWSSSPDGILDLCNKHLLDFVGMPAEEVLGMGFYRIFHPDDTPILLAAWQEIMASRLSREIEARIRSADGGYRWFMFRQNPLLDADGNVIKWYGAIFDIEDRKRAEDALREARLALLASEQNLRLIVDSLPVLAWGARPDGGADFVNKGWAEYAGVDAEKILEWGFLNFYHPDDKERMVKTWQDSLATENQMGLKGRIRRHDGEYRWFYFAGQKMTDANGVERWVGANVDIEDLQRAEDALKASEQDLKLIIDTIPAMAWSSTAEGEVDFWNKNLLDFCGLTYDQIAGEGYYRIFHPDDLEPMRQTWDSARAEKRGKEVDARIRRADGEYRWFNFRQRPLLGAGGEVLKWYGALIEIEDRRRAEEELRQSQSELARVARVTTLGELAVSIAHEVNQPLMAIVTNAGTCLRWLDEAQFDATQARQAAERVIRDGHRAGEIIASIRALAQKSPTRLEPMDLREAIEDVLMVLNGELRRREIDAKSEVVDEGLIVLGDRTQLQQVLLNLVMNGVEAMADNGGVRRRLTIRSATRSGRFAEISVADTGAGLADGHADRMFEAFFSTKPDGIGMGLSICRSIIEAHGGSISASANIPRGSIFSFTVPMANQGMRA